MDIEEIKQEGLALDFEKIAETGTLALGPGDAYRLKTHGFCTQKHPGYFIFRIRIPGGVVTTLQLNGLVKIIEAHGRGSAHLTSRQGLELRFVRVEEANSLFKALQSLGLTSHSTDGHTLRNVMACPHGGIVSEGLLDVGPWAQAVSDYFVKQSNTINPLLPNRLNMAFFGCSACNPTAVFHDIAFVAVKGKEAVGFELWAGGGLGPDPLSGYRVKEFIPLSDVLPACIALVNLYTKCRSVLDHPALARIRLKHVIAEWGQKRFTAAFHELFIKEKAEGKTPPDVALPAEPGGIARFLNSLIPSPPLPDGAFCQRQKGYAYVKIAVPLGEIHANQIALVSQMARKYGDGKIYFTSDQAMELHWIPLWKISRVIKGLKNAGLALKTENGPHVLSCSGTEFCVLAAANAQSVARDFLRAYKPVDPDAAAMVKTLAIHISGCENGCARHHLGDIGLAGERVEGAYAYHLFLGGHRNIPGEKVKSGITEDQVRPTIEAIHKIVLEHRRNGETFREVITRIGIPKIAAFLEGIRPTPTEEEPLMMVTDWSAS